MADAHNHEYVTNTHILVHDFNYIETGTIEETLSLLAKYGERAKIIAGGTHLIVVMKMEHEAPEVVINVGKVKGLDTIARNAKGELVIGSLASIRSIRHNPTVATCYQSLAEACSSFGGAQIEIMGTIGGNVCNGSPAADTVPALMALDARVVIRSTKATREVPVEKFILSPGKVDLQPDEFVTEIILPPTLPETVGAFVKVTRVAADLAKASLAISLVRDGDRIIDVRIACGAVSPTPIRIHRAEAILKDKYFSDSLIEEAGKIVSEDISPINDIRSQAWYRREVLRVATIDTLNKLWLKAAEGNCDPKNLPAYFNLGSDKVVNHVPGLVDKDGTREIEFTLNGVKKRIAVKPNELLQSVIHDRLMYTGTKYGCGVGECGACTVLLNDQPVFSCLVLAISVDGKDVKTVEGLAGPNGELDPLQTAFIEHASYQCGYCTPGFLMTLKGFLKENPNPDDDEIRDNIKGNRCRCTGYFSIIRAVKDTIQKTSGSH